MEGGDMFDPEVLTRAQRLAARRELLSREKELTKHRDELNAARRRLPMVEITKPYSLDGPQAEGSPAPKPLVRLFGSVQRSERTRPS